MVAQILILICHLPTNHCITTVTALSLAINMHYHCAVISDDSDNNISQVDNVLQTNMHCYLDSFT